MNVENYRVWFLAGSLALMLVAATPTLALFIHLPNSQERFSEFWLLGPEHKAENYPFNIVVNENYSVYVGVGNHLGYSAYYRILVKFRNETQPLPTAINSTQSSLPPLYEFDLFVGDSEIWETLATFKILNAERTNDSMNLSRLQINEVPIQVDSASTWNETRRGFYFQLFFELWLYNMTTQNFQYHNRFVGIWLHIVSWIEGTVTDAVTTDPIVGATVSANGVSAVTNSSGGYRIEVSPGTYDVTASMTGYTSKTATGVVVVADATKVQDFALVPIVDNPS